MARIKLASIQLRAGEIASKTGRDRLAVTQDLLDAHIRRKVEIDYGTAGEDQNVVNDLNFAKFDPNKTQPLPVDEED